MVSGLTQQYYQEFQQALQQLRTIAAQSHPDPTALQSQFLELQQFFQRQMIGLDLAELPPAMQAKVHSYQVEANKQLRILGMDVMFLQAARQPATMQQRQAQMIDRIDTLLRYCEAVLGK